MDKPCPQWNKCPLVFAGDTVSQYSAWWCEGCGCLTFAESGGEFRDTQFPKVPA